MPKPMRCTMSCTNMPSSRPQAAPTESDGRKIPAVLLLNELCPLRAEHGVEEGLVSASDELQLYATTISTADFFSDLA